MEKMEQTQFIVETKNTSQNGRLTRCLWLTVFAQIRLRRTSQTPGTLAEMPLACIIKWRCKSLLWNQSSKKQQ